MTLRPNSPCHNDSTLPCGTKAAIGNLKVKEHSYVSINVIHKTGGGLKVTYGLEFANLCFILDILCLNQ